MERKKCGKVGSKKVFFKEELIALAVKTLKLPENKLKRMTKEELCRLLNIKWASPLQVVHKTKICSDKKTAAYPNRYTKEELAEVILQKGIKNFSRSQLLKKTYKELCGLAGIQFFVVPNKPKNGEKKKKKESPMVIGEGSDGIMQSKTSANCIMRSHTQPLDHQRRVIQHFERHRGLIAVHSVGSGKTLTAVIASQCYLDRHPTHHVVVISPTSLIANFKKEMTEKYGNLRHADKYQFYSFQGFQYKFQKKPMPCKNIFLIIDEAHNLRLQYRKSKTGKEIGIRNKLITDCAKKANQVLLLTATPVINFPGDVAALLNLVRGAREPYIKKAEVDKNWHDQHYLNMIGKNKFSFYSRGQENFPQRHDMPPVYLEMPAPFLKSYNKVEAEETGENQQILKIFGDVKLKPFYNGVRRAVNILSELPEEDLVKSPKVKWILKQVQSGNKKTVIFSHFLEMGIDAIRKRLPDHIRSAHITGSRSKKERAEIVKKYNNDEIDVLFISKAGGEGLDLKGTRQIILMESGWNQNTEEQVIGRGIRYKSHDHLPPEERFVEVYRLYHVKPEEKGHEEELIESAAPDFQDPNTWLSADLMLRFLSLRKQNKIDLFTNFLRQLSIENNM